VHLNHLLKVTSQSAFCFSLKFSINKQLFSNEIVFRLRKDIGIPRKLGQLEESGCGAFVVTCIGYYRKHILPCHFASGEAPKWSPNWTANDPMTGNDSCKWCRKKSRMVWTVWLMELKKNCITSATNRWERRILSRPGSVGILEYKI